ncbi:MAG: SHOCT domain-containing protein [Actinobacteria bacterium]|nr:SHOCT domain-containing protein [Actinomycetota bacterium]
MDYHRELVAFLKNLKESLAPTPIPIEELRGDLQPLVKRLHERDRQNFLAWCGAYGGALDNVREDEAFRGAIPSVGGDDLSDGPEGRGILVLTDERLMFMGDLNRFEVPLHQIGMSNWGVTKDTGLVRAPTLEVGVGPSNSPLYAFGLSTLKRESWEPFVSTLETVVREAERARNAAPGQRGQESVADELAKFARLRDAGVITEAEFEQKKASLLRR